MRGRSGAERVRGTPGRTRPARVWLATRRPRRAGARRRVLSATMPAACSGYAAVFFAAVCATSGSKEV
ncbi:hypothetical protein [Actinomadura sp. NBRC 104412]|uniref:hypothetical protein n=1 Tax=Actinomadura sp. NBRC 104412 TaxID=3032203 RepID=UPI002555F0F7|nr:hypothetical protein [Actinomadura sp. NBRC 104412]